VTAEELFLPIAGRKTLSRAIKEPTSVNIDDLDWLRLLIGTGGRRLERQVTASLKVTSSVRLTHAEKIDALLVLAARGVQAAERIAAWMDQGDLSSRRRHRRKPRQVVRKKRTAAPPKTEKKHGKR
jgi:hypothetical protein